MSRGREDIEFMQRGVQYYVAARYSAWSGLWVCGNLYHHALEMFLKSGLSQKRSLPELKKFQHKLVNIWNAFKADFPAALSQFDETITELADFEEIRYPDEVLKNGAQIIIDYHRQGQPERSVRPEPEYRLDFYELDRLIGAIMEAGNVNPAFYLSGLKPEVREMLGRDNPVAAYLLSRES